MICAAVAPPPYFPTTGYFVWNAYYQIGPTGFDIDEHFSLITP